MPFSTAKPDAVANVYARSLFDLAHESGGRGVVEGVLGELEDILEVARATPSFAELLSSRVVPANRREQSLRRILQGRASDLCLRFMLVLNRKDRLGSLPQIAEAFDAIAQQAFGRVEVDVITASELPAGEVPALRDRLSKALSKDVVVHTYVEPAMLGGVKLRVGDRLVDGSIQTRLRRMKDQLAGSGLASLRSRMDRTLGS